MSLKFNADIKNIRLENFQSIRERTEIPIRPVTFLYGPNSAGKSSILDSLVFVDAVLNKDKFSIEDMRSRWLHRQSHGVHSGPTTPPTMSIEVQFDAYEFFNFTLGIHSNDAPSVIWGDGNLVDTIGTGAATIDLKIALSSNVHIESIEIHMAINGLPLLDISKQEHDETGSPLILNFFTNGYGKTFDTLADQHGISRDGGYYCNAPCWLAFKPLSLLAGRGGDDYDNSLIALANYILRCLQLYSFTPTNVSADRKTIKNHELTTIVTDKYRYGVNGIESIGLSSSYIKAPIEATENLNKFANPIIDSICRSKFDETFTSVSDSAQDAPDGEPREAVHDFVNRCLADHLFIDQGYQLAFDVCRLLPDRAINRRGGTADPVALIVCSLQDKSGRRLTFEDVGTGISCVIPALHALYSWQSFIQQPELHLHPALQSAFGDILVEAARHKTAHHIIETHSEYVLLRCLRRIRESTNGKHLKSSPLFILPQDVCVLFFDPQPDGATQVKRLRISSQGDFIDRWPRGFFEERGRDIFDE